MKLGLPDRKYRVVCSRIVMHRIDKQHHYDYRWFWQAELRAFVMTHIYGMFCTMYIRRMYAKL